MAAFIDAQQSCRCSVLPLADALVLPRIITETALGGLGGGGRHGLFANATKSNIRTFWTANIPTQQQRATP